MGATPEREYRTRLWHGRYWVMDVDFAGWEATEPDGLDLYSYLINRYGPLPKTAMQLTGGGGYQFFFTADPRVQNSVKFLPGLDTRSTGGYVVVPPSIHPSGRSYRWRRDHGPHEIEIATAPEWLIAILEPLEDEPEPTQAPSRPIARVNRYAAGALRKACEAIAAAPPGVQETTLVKEALGIGGLVAGGYLPAPEARAHLVASGRQMVNDPRKRPWTISEIERKITRIFATVPPRTVEA